MRRLWSLHGARIVFGVVMLLLAANIYVLAHAFRLMGTAEDVDALAAARRGALVLSNYYSQLAEQSGLGSNQAVREALAKFRFEVEQAGSEREVAEAISRWGQQAYDVISREEEELDRRAIFAIIASEPNVANYQGTASIVVVPGPGQIDIQDDRNLLPEGVREKIRKAVTERRMTSVVQVDIGNGKASLLSTRSVTGQISTLRKEVNALRSQLQLVMQTGGYSEMSGKGIVLRASVRKDGDVSGTMFGYDVRDIVNELFAAGARGVEIGGQRLVATSSIRSVGESLLVNHKPVPTNPVIIKAVGEPEVLESSLDLLINAPYFALDVAISRQDPVILKAYAL